MTAIEIIKDAAARLNTEQIERAIRAIGGGNVPADNRLVRAALIEMILDRDGESAADDLMDDLGM